MVTLSQMPKVYEASTRIWVSPQEIPEDVVRPTVKDDLSERLLMFRNAVLGQPYMEELITRTFGTPGSDRELQRLLDHVKGSVEVRGERDADVTFFTLTYNDSEPERAAEVVNSLTELYVEQNARFRIERTERSSEQMAQLANGAKEELDRAEQALAEFKKRHPFADRSVETHLELISTNVAEITRIGDSRSRLEEDIRQLRGHRQRVESSSGDVPWTGAGPVDPLTEQLRLARRELEDLRSRLTELHPDLKRKAAQVAELEKRVAERASQPTPGAPSDRAPVLDPVTADLERQIAAKEVELKALAAQEQRLLGENAAVRRRLDDTTETGPMLNKLLEERRLAEDKYRELQQRAEEIATSHDIELADLGEKMEVLEYAKVPSIPVAPDPFQVYVLGIGFGCLLFIGPVLTRHLLNPVIGSEAAMIAVAEFPVVVTIPRIVTSVNSGDTRRMWFKNVSLSLLSLAVLAAAMVWGG
jgi:uncharacterized protein involved in exopolysaccharide biosynthesis